MYPPSPAARVLAQDLVALARGEALVAPGDVERGAEVVEEWLREHEREELPRALCGALACVRWRCGGAPPGRLEAQWIKGDRGQPRAPRDSITS